jgi:hypothetical protein
MEKRINDPLKFLTDPEILKQLVRADDVLQMSCKVKKWNKYNMRQERNLVVSDMLIYNFKQKTLRRSIDIHILTGITKNLNQGSIEYVIHVKDEPDIRIDYEDRDYMI